MQMYYYIFLCIGTVNSFVVTILKNTIIEFYVFRFMNLRMTSIPSSDRILS